MTDDRHHGDLPNLFTDAKNNFRMIGFYPTRIGHLMNGFAKMENDIKFILRPVNDEIALQRAFATEYALICHPGDPDLTKVSETEWGALTKRDNAKIPADQIGSGRIRYGFIAVQRAQFVI